MKMLVFSLVLIPFILLDSYQFMTVPDMDTTPVEEDTIDTGDAIRGSPLGSGVEMVNYSDIQELRERTIANVSYSLSNTSLTDLESDNLTQLLLMRYRERKRQERLQDIQTLIIQGLRINRRPNMSGNFLSLDEQRRLNVIVGRMHFGNNNNNHHQLDTDPFFEHGTTTTSHQMLSTIQRLQSFYPSCSLPNNTDKQTWENPKAFRIFYELPASLYTLGPKVTVLVAKLRLYKKAPNFGEGWEFNLTELQRYNLLDAMMDGTTGAINVSVYQYLRPVRHNRKEKKRLVDSRTVILDYEGWVEFTVVSSLNFWMQNTHRNFGLDVEIEDAMGNKLDPNIFFRNMNCSLAETETQDPPFPNIVELHPEMMGENESSLFDNETYPTLDLQTADMSTISAAEFHLIQPSQFFDALQMSNKRLLRKRHLHLRRHDIAEDKTQCISEKTYYTFEELGLGDTVLFPEGFQWTFCHGACPSPHFDRTAASTALLQQPSNQFFHRLSRLWRFLLKYTTNQKDTECVSTGRKHLHIIYLNDSKAAEEVTFENFIPTECACATS